MAWGVQNSRAERAFKVVTDECEWKDRTVGLGRVMISKRNSSGDKLLFISRSRPELKLRALYPYPSRRPIVPRITLRYLLSRRLQ